MLNSIKSGACGAAIGLFLMGTRKLQKVIHPKTFLLNVLFNSFLYTLFMIVPTTISLWAMSTFSNGLGSSDFSHRINKLLAGPIYQFAGIFFAWTLVALSVRAISRKLGPGVLLNLIRGYYYQPRSEERIFMFLDLRDSTTHAETLGDEKFSALLRDFFNDITDPLIETRGEVSHYIGDEVVLTWRPKHGLRDSNVIRLFYYFREVLNKRSKYYIEQYGFIPQFKAGAHMGSVIATEVGQLKSEIVFLGDVLNTTARIQSTCNELGADLLISDDLSNKLPLDIWYLKVPVGAVELKGKAQQVALNAIKLRDDPTNSDSADVLSDGNATNLAVS